jgi:uncharacterized protein (UPF0548 family)
MFLVARPAADTVHRWLERQASLPLPPAPSRTGMDVDRSRAPLGTGAAMFPRAAAALRDWAMFRVGWVEVFPRAAPIRVGTTVGVLVHHLGLWSLNPCRIVALVEDTGPVERFGFVYRTLPEHALEGEERFVVEWQHDDDRVAYDVTAWSRPRHLLARVGRPLARRVQRRFARDSRRAMQAALAFQSSASSRP